MKKKLQEIKFLLPVGEAKSGPVLAPILGQSQINIIAFCKDFNDLTAHLNEGIQLPVKITKFEDKTFVINFKSPTLNFILEQIVMTRETRQDFFKKLRRREVYDIFKIVTYFYTEQKVLVQSEIKIFKEILSFLKSKKTKITRRKKILQSI